MPRTWENKRQSNGSMTQSSLQDSAELADHRGEKGSERQQTFFSHRENYCNSWIYQVVAARTGGTSVTFFPLQQLPHPCFPATSCSLLIPSGAHQTEEPILSLSATSVNWMWLQTGSEECQSCRTQQKWHKSEPETGRRRRQQGFLALCHWDLPNSIKSPHAILNYLELLKLSEYKLSLKERTTWEGFCVAFCIGGMFQNHTEENAFSEDYSTAGLQKNYPSKKEYRKSPYSHEM